ncbi:MAG: amino acid permease [Chloroflexi bacterium]|nr:amino acid permease [Chloroflexota bacterium]
MNNNPARPPSQTPEAPPPDTAVEWREAVRGGRPGDRYVRIGRYRGFRAAEPRVIVARSDDEMPPHSPVSRAVLRLSRLVFGKPIPTSEESSERVGVFTGLAIFADSNISSSAYATEEIMRVLVAASVGALGLTMPITMVVVVVLAIVVLSYRLVIHAYPGGGGSYVVARENLGAFAGLTAAAALLTDYILTVSVSVAAGVAALTSAFPSLYEHRTGFSLAGVVLMTILNVRGIRESAALVAAPTYVNVYRRFSPVYPSA